MHAVDPAVKSRLAPLLRRVLIVDPNAHLAELLGGCLTGFGAKTIILKADPDAGVEAARATEPTLIVTEALADADPFALVRSIRRSAMACRQTPVVVLTTLATASALQAAKDAGAHEFLRKPFDRRDLMRRLDHLARAPRPWVDKPDYSGPDRRTFNSGAAMRRLSDRLELIGQGVSASRLYLAGQTARTP
jgi:DNA-binding response OmpR family regulator